MSFKELLERLRKRKDDLWNRNRFAWTEEDEMSMKTVRKQVPRKPYQNEYDIRCSECKKRLILKGSKLYYPKYCSRCGQKIDWSGLR